MIDNFIAARVIPRSCGFCDPPTTKKQTEIDPLKISKKIK
jgi:hypothetical protein